MKTATDIEAEIDAIAAREAEAQRIREQALPLYAKLLNATPLDAPRIRKIAVAMQLTPEQIDADLSAARQLAAAKAKRVDESKLAIEFEQAFAHEEKLTATYLAAKQAMESANHAKQMILIRRSEADADRRNAIVLENRLRKTSPRIFGRLEAEQAPPEPPPPSISWYHAAK